MRKIGDASFFRIVDRLLVGGTSRTPATRWSIDGVEWQRERHSYAGASHGFTLEVTTGTKAEGTKTAGKAAPPGWALVVVKEYWRAKTGESLKSLQWAHIDSGSRADVVGWLERQGRRLDNG